MKPIFIISVLSISIIACEWKPPRRPNPNDLLSQSPITQNSNTNTSTDPSKSFTPQQVSNTNQQQSNELNNQEENKEVTLADEHIKPSSHLLQPSTSQTSIPSSVANTDLDDTDHVNSKAPKEQDTSKEQDTPKKKDTPTPKEQDASIQNDQTIDSNVKTPSQEKEVFRVAKKQQVSEVIDDSIVKIHEFSVGRYIENGQAQHKFARYESNSVGFVAYLKTENIQKAIGLNVVWIHAKHKQVTRLHVKKGPKVRTWSDIKLPISESKRFGQWQVELRTMKTNLLLAITSFELLKP